MGFPIGPRWARKGYCCEGDSGSGCDKASGLEKDPCADAAVAAVAVAEAEAEAETEGETTPMVAVVLFVVGSKGAVAEETLSPALDKPEISDEWGEAIASAAPSGVGNSAAPFGGGSSGEKFLLPKCGGPRLKGTCPPPCTIGWVPNGISAG